MIFKAFKVRLEPNNKARTLFLKNCGAARWAFNWALDQKKKCFNNKEKIPNQFALHRNLNKLKGTEVLPWAYEVSKCSLQNALIDCDRAFQNYFTRCKKNVKGKNGFPKFKSKKNEKLSIFQLIIKYYLLQCLSWQASGLCRCIWRHPIKSFLMPLMR